MFIPASGLVFGVVVVLTVIAYFLLRDTEGKGATGGYGAGLAMIGVLFELGILGFFLAIETIMFLLWRLLQ